MLYPKLESGNNLSEVYQSTFFLPRYERWSISPYIASNYNGELDYGLMIIYSDGPYGTLSFSYLEKNVDQVFKRPTGDFHFFHKESAYNLTYQKRLGKFNLQVGGNFSDPIHLKAFEYNGQILPSMNIGFQMEPSPYIMIEGGLTNLFKKSSQLVIDKSEEFFTSTALMLRDSLSLKLSLHKFKGRRINANLLSRYYLSKKDYIGLNLSSNPSALTLSASTTGSTGSIKITAGLKGKNFYSLLAFSVPYSYDPKPRMGIIGHTGKKGRLASKNKSSYLININTASERELELLPNVGPKTAKKIIRFRKQNDLFYEKVDIMKVPGIGPKKYRLMKDLITVGSVDPKDRFRNIKNWTMKEFVDLGFSPSLALRLVLFIKDKELYHTLKDLLKVNGFSKNSLRRLIKKLKEYGYDPKD